MQDRLLKYKKIIDSQADNSYEKPVKIQDILLMSDKGEHIPYGVQNPDTTEDPLPRIIKLIESFAQRAKGAHLANDKPTLPYELITRVVLNEFSLYTQDKPLSLEQYKTLIAAINDIAKELPPNIHLIVATFPVLWPDGTLHNVGLYVESPLTDDATATLRHFDKREPHISDLKYTNGCDDRTGRARKTLRFYGESRIDDKALDDYHGTPLSPNKVLSDTVVRVNDINQYRGAIIVKTLGGKRILITLEICREHVEEVSISDVKWLEYQLKQQGETLPIDVNQVIISHHVSVKKAKLVTDSFVHADSNVLGKNAVRINDAAFGKNWRLAVNPPTSLGTLNKENLNRPTKFTSSLFAEIQVESNAEETFERRTRSVINEY